MIRAGNKIPAVDSEHPLAMNTARRPMFLVGCWAHVGGGGMDDALGRFGSAFFGGALTASVAYITGLRQRRLTWKIAGKKELEEAVGLMLEYQLDSERLVDVTSEIHGRSDPTIRDIENMFKIHPMDVSIKSSSTIQKLQQLLPESDVGKHRAAAEARSNLFTAYRKYLFPDAQRNDDTAISALTELISEVYQTSASVLNALPGEIDELQKRIDTLQRELGKYGSA